MTRADQLEEFLWLAVSTSYATADAVLEPIRMYDHQHHGDLVKTLSTYLALGCNATRAAEALDLHRSGLLYRLGRIEQLLGVNLGTYLHRVALELAILAMANRPNSV